MSSPGGSADVLIVIQAIDKASKQLQAIGGQLGALSKQMQGSGQAAQQASTQTKGFFDQISDNFSFLSKATVALYGIGRAIGFVGEGFNQLESGAAVTQTTLSFEQMTESVGVSVSLLDELQKAANGTIPSLQLMSLATTALSGATYEFGNALATSLPHILEIAKAANKANPALGSVDYQFQSLIVGLKRLSPRLIDNTGLQVKLGIAFEDMADSLEKSREELTAEEQQLALLNATLEAGDRLIRQIGGSAESLTDPYEQVKASLADIANVIKQDWARAFDPAIKGLAEMLDGIRLVETAHREGKISILTYAYAMDQLIRGVIDADAASVMITKDMYFLGKVEESVAQSSGLMKEEIERAGGSVEGFTDSSKTSTVVVEEFSRELVKTGTSAVSAKDALAKMKEMEKAAAEETKRLKSELSKFNEEMGQLEFLINGPVAEAYTGFSEAQSDIKKDIIDYKKEIRELGGLQYVSDEDIGKINTLRGELASAFGELVRLQEIIKASEERDTKAGKKGGFDLIPPKKIDAAKEKLQELRNTIGELQRELEAMGVSPNIKKEDLEKIQELQTKIDEATLALDAESEAFKRNTSEIIFNMAQKQIAAAVEAGLIKDTNNSGTAYDEASRAMTVLAVQMGLIDESTAALQTSVVDTTGAFIDGKISLYEWARQLLGDRDIVTGYKGDVDGLDNALRGLPSNVKTTYTLEYKIKGEPSGAFEVPIPQPKGGPAPKPKGEALGGPVAPNTPYWVGEYGPELFVPPAYGKILSVFDLPSQSKDTPSQKPKMDALNETVSPNQNWRVPELFMLSDYNKANPTHDTEPLQSKIPAPKPKTKMLGDPVSRNQPWELSELFMPLDYNKTNPIPNIDEKSSNQPINVTIYANLNNDVDVKMLAYQVANEISRRQ